MSYQKDKYLFFGPSGLLNGQSISFDFLYTSLGKHSLRVNSSVGRSRFINTFMVFTRLTCVLIVNKPRTIYMSGSRSVEGILKEIPIYLYSFCFRGIKVINHIHGSDLSNISRTHFFQFCINRVVTDWIFLDDSLVTPHRDYLLGNCHVVRNFIPEFDSTVEFSQKKNQVLYLSNLLASKGILDLISAAKIFLEVNTEWHLYICGEFMSDHLMTKTEISRRFYDALSSLGDVGCQIHLLGAVNRQEAEILFRSKIFCLQTIQLKESLYR